MWWRRAAREHPTAASAGSGASRVARRRKAPAWLLALALSGCSAVVDSDLGPPPLACRLGDINDCRCRDGSYGVQNCTIGGSYDACRNAAGAICENPASAGRGAAGDD
jgi:hypothetical protein